MLTVTIYNTLKNKSENRKNEATANV